MAKTLKKEKVSAIERDIWAAWNANQYPDLHAIAESYGCSYQSVCYIRRRIEKLERTGIDERKKSGRKPIPEEEYMASAILDILTRKPESNQREVSDAIYEQFGKRLCQASISRIYKKHGIPHKISNKLYKNSKMFTTHPSGIVRLQPVVQQTYRSPYGPMLMGNTASTELQDALANDNLSKLSVTGKCLVLDSGHCRSLRLDMISRERSYASTAHTYT